jgi:hypothetical protein
MASNIKKRETAPAMMLLNPAAPLQGQSVPFEKLPPKLRDKVYREMLVAEVPVIIERRRRTPSAREIERLAKETGIKDRYRLRQRFPRFFVARHFLESRVEITLPGENQPGPFKFASNNPLSRRLVSRNRYKEAAAILYAENHFVFGSVPAMSQFCEDLQVGRKLAKKAGFLRSVEIRNAELGANLFELRAAAKCNLKLHIIMPSGSDREWHVFYVLKMILPWIEGPAYPSCCRCINSPCTCVDDRSEERIKRFEKIRVVLHGAGFYADLDGKGLQERKSLDDNDQKSLARLLRRE